MSRVSAYILIVSALAVIAAAFLYVGNPAYDSSLAQAAICFATLGFLGQMLAYSTGPAVGGASSFLPFLTAAVLAPNWVTCAAVATAVLSSAMALRRPSVKTVFNVAQLTLAIALAIIVYRALGGQPLISSSKNVPAYVGLVLTFASVNALAVSGVIAVSERRHVASVLSENPLKRIGYDVLSVPFVFFFAKVYVEWGVTGVAGLAIPLLGVRQLYKANADLERAHHELLEMMVANLEARDPYTSGHSRRVARNARIIARAIGLSSKQVERVAVAALLHDVGKIDEVFGPLLRKPDRLTPEEWAVMETHPIKSAELVAKSSQLKDVVGPVRHHHENWDGSGYPDGLAGEEIPLGARIIMFADTTDAMTTDRPYRRAMSPQQVRDEFVRQRGRQFDPELCDRLLASPQFELLFLDPSKHTTPAFFPRLERGKKTSGVK
jgi:putative nucleotidyltransferase with HDIG domain